MTPLTQYHAEVCANNAIIRVSMVNVHDLLPVSIVNMSAEDS